MESEPKSWCIVCGTRATLSSGVDADTYDLCNMHHSISVLAANVMSLKATVRELQQKRQYFEDHYEAAAKTLLQATNWRPYGNDCLREYDAFQRGLQFGKTQAEVTPGGE